MWTMDELVERVRRALAAQPPGEAEYPGAPNGRVRDVPDRRAIRWYTTIGLVDRPLGMRGRTALYGPRHLQQLVAIKRLQATGRTLAQIQGDFTWFSDEALSDASRVPDDLLEADGPQPDPPAGAPRIRFWTEAPEAGVPPGRHHATPHRRPGQPVPTFPEPAPPEPALPEATLPAPGRSDRAASDRAASDRAARPVSGVTLGGGAILLVPHPVSDRDRADIAAAAAPLLDLLAARGLIDGRKS
jgi:hypothetical protein